MIDNAGKKTPLLPDKSESQSEILPLRTEFCQMSGMALQLSSTRVVRILLTTIDAAFLGHLGTPQLAAVSLAGMWQGVPSTFVQFTIQAITTLCSQARGAGNNELVGDWLQTALLIAVIGSVPVGLIFWNVHYLVGITMSDPETVDFARQFSQIMMWSLLPQYIYVALTSYFATISVVMPATCCTCISVVANTVFNYVFIYGYGSFKGLGFIGSPLATVTTSYLQLFLFGMYTIKIKGYHREFWGGWKKEAISWDRISTFLALGIPTGLSSVIDWASGAVAGSFSGLCGVQVAAGQNMMGGLFSLTYSTVSGFSTATQIRLARYLGEGNPQAAKRILRIGSATLLAGGVIICGLLTVFHDKAWQIWTTDESLIALCNTSLLAFMAGLIMAYLRFTLTVVSVSLGPKEARINLIANNIASWVIYIPLAYVMPIMWKWGLPGFWWSDFCGEAFKVACLFWCVSNVDWAQAARDARAKATMANEDTEECEKLEKWAYTSLGSYTMASPTAATSNLALHSPMLLTGHAAEGYEAIAASSPNMKDRFFHRTPSTKFTHIDSL